MEAVREELRALYNKVKTPEAVEDETRCIDKARVVMQLIEEAQAKGEVGIGLYNADEVRGLLQMLRDAGFYVCAVPTGGISSKHIIAWDPRYSHKVY